MNNDVQRIGSWNGLILMQETGASSSGAHGHPSHMLRLQTQGVTVNEWRSTTRSGTTILGPGNLAIIPASIHHGTCVNNRHESSEEEPQQVVALLSEAMLQEAAEATLVRGSNIRLEENRNFRDVQLERLLWMLYNEGSQKSPVSHLVGDTVSSAIAIPLIGNHASSQHTIPPYRGGIPRHQLNRVLDYIEAHLRQDLSLSALAEAAATSPFHFSRAFRQSMGVTPHQYVLAQRVECAKSLLRNHELTIGEISLSAGFTRQNHFARVFQKKTGLTPTEFRRRLLITDTQWPRMAGSRNSTARAARAAK
jgi:AraC family transcriptional regulator